MEESDKHYKETLFKVKELGRVRKCIFQKDNQGRTGREDNIRAEI